MILTPELLEAYLKAASMINSQAHVNNVYYATRRFQRWLADRPVSPELIKEYIDFQIAKNCRNSALSNWTWLRHWFQWAIIMRHWEGPNPVLKRRDLFCPYSERIPFRVDEYVRMQQGCVNLTRADDFRYLLAMGWHTGARLRDVVMMGWSNVDWLTDSIKWIPSKTKRFGKQIVVPMAPELKALLSRLQLKAGDNLLISPWLAGSYMRDHNTIAKGMYKLESMANMPTKKSFHCFRHAFVTRLLEANVNPVVIADMTGHGLKEIMRYQHVGLEIKRKVLLEAV